jgi:tetratricopeptide (TPR) repeat protein
MAMKSKLVLTCGLIFVINTLTGQNIPVNQRIDLMLLRGEYEKVIDTCRMILDYDNLNPDIYYRLGIAYLNTLEDDLSLDSFYQANSLNPGNKVFNFMLAKGYYGKGKYKLAEPLLEKLCSTDTMNWTYASYLTSIYMHYKKYDEAINIYKRFLRNDSTNYNLLNKTGFAFLEKGEYEYANELYKKSLSLNEKNLVAIKNLAYLYSATRQSDSAIAILSKGIVIDSTDMRLFSMRAQLYYSRKYNKRALNDYLVILASGDSSELYLKRAGICYCNNLQPAEAITYLLKAYTIDSSDYETCSYLGQSFFNLRDMDKSIYYYNRVIKILSQVQKQLGLSYILLAESQKGKGLYKDAIASFLLAQKISTDANIFMIIANIYDEQLNDSKKAIFYYQTFLDNLKNAKGTFSEKYFESIKARMEFLKKDQAAKANH